MREAIERVILELEDMSFYHGKQYTNKWADDRSYHLGCETGLDKAIKELKAVIASETNSPDRTDGSGPDDAKRKVDQ